MTKQSKIIILLAALLIVCLGYIGFTETVKWFNGQQAGAYNAGASAMRQAVFEAVSKSEIQISDVSGKNTITIIKK